MNSLISGADYASPAIRIIRIGSMLLGMMLVASAFAAILTGVVANSGDNRSDTWSVGIAIGALIIGTPIVLIANIWANLFARERAFPVYVVSWIAMLVIAFIAVRDAESGVSTALVLVFVVPGLIFLPVQIFLFRLGKRIANGWPFTGNRGTAGRTGSQADTTAASIAHDSLDSTRHHNDDPKSGGDNRNSHPDSTPDTGGSGSSDSGSSDSGGSSGGDSGGGGGSDSGGSSS